MQAWRVSFLTLLRALIQTQASSLSQNTRASGSPTTGLLTDSHFCFNLLTWVNILHLIPHYPLLISQALHYTLAHSDTVRKKSVMWNTSWFKPGRDLWPATWRITQKSRRVPSCSQIQPSPAIQALFQNCLLVYLEPAALRKLSLNWFSVFTHFADIGLKFKPWMCFFFLFSFPPSLYSSLFCPLSSSSTSHMP